jgi:hypothetical protein
VPERIADLLRLFDQASNAPALRCRIGPIRPALGYSLRFSAGLRISFPLRQFSGLAHYLDAYFRITSQGQAPVFQVQAADIPDLPAANAEGELVGTFSVGEGEYSVDALVPDDLQRICRRSWPIQAMFSGGERELRQGIPPNTVVEYSSAGPTGIDTTGPKIARLTVMLQTAPFAPLAPKLRDADVQTFVQSLSAVLDQLPARFVRVVLFNLDQRRTILQENGFTREQLGEVNDALGQVEVGHVDYRVFESDSSASSFLSGLIEKELHEILGVTAGATPPRISGRHRRRRAIR